MNTPFRLPRWPSGTDPRTRDRPGHALAKATVFRALRSKLGGRPLPAAGGQPRRCTGVRPNPSLAVGSRNFFRNHLEEPSIVDRGAFRCFRKAIGPSESAKGREPAAGSQPVAGGQLLELRLGA